MTLAVAAVAAGVGLASAVGPLPAQGALSTAPYRFRRRPVPSTASYVCVFIRPTEPFYLAQTLSGERDLLRRLLPIPVIAKS